MAVLEMFGETRQDSDNIAADPARLVNCYRQATGGRFVLRAVPGLLDFASLADPVGRAIGVVGDVLYVVSGGALYSVNDTGTANLIGAIADDDATTFAGYQSNLSIAAGGNYYVWNGSALSTVGSGAFSSVGSVSFVGGYTVLTERNGSRFEWTELQTPGTRNALHVASAEARDDVILSAQELDGNLYLFGSRSIEIWGVTGLAGAAAFSRLASVGSGLGAMGTKNALVTGFPGGLFMVGSDGVVYLLSGAQAAPVSGRGVETAIAAETPTHCYYYEVEGQKFCVIRFASRPAWVYDVSMGEWHERATGPTLGAWGVVGAAKAYGKWRALSGNGDVSTFAGSADGDEPVIMRAVSREVTMDGARFRVSKVEARAKTGFGGDLSLRVSRDRGRTFGDAKTRNLGATGEYEARPVWRGLGQFRSFVMELSQAGDLPIYTHVIVDVV